METLSVHAMGHQPIGREHHRSPRRLHRNHNVVKVEAIANADEFQCRFHHPRGRIAVGKEHPLCQGTVVNPDAQGLVLLLEQGHQGFKRGLDPFTNLRDFSVGKGGSIGIGLVKDKQARIDPHLVHVLGHLQGDLHAVVVHICHQGHRLVGVFQALADLLHRLGMGQAGHGEAHNFAARLMQPANPCGGPFDVEGVLIDHRLDRHGVVTADPDVTHPHAAGFAATDHRVKAGIVSPIGCGSFGTGQGASHGEETLRWAKPVTGKRSIGEAARQRHGDPPG